MITARGTPNTFINGRKLTGANPFEDSAAVIDEELKRAQQKLADGVKRHFGEAGLVCLIEALGFIEGRIRLALMFTALGAVTAH